MVNERGWCVTVGSVRRLAAAALIAASTAAFLGGVGCSDREKLPLTPDEFTTRGWERYSDGDLAAALQDFERAIGIDDAFGPAYVGLGWAQLGLATSAPEMAVAAVTFETAAASQSGPEVDAGRAAAELGAGGSGLVAAVSYAQAARTEGSFVFSHRPSIDTTDLFLIEATALAAQGDFANALLAADAAPVADSGITAGDSGTWQVDGTTYPTFESAVLAFLHELSKEHAG
ncbi:MAG: hypothetical protein KDA27_09960 [Candidatus Eisenbacteria bacterium]|uniref:Tetratricopeptide repeat protein n=1 Tax=Eiseniibacteriota bacterium TaxID=2212470 RepID=A0A956NBU8_UNCEI|nr:hypothetical protein [Candidatus Eisenbacteria bacterium]